MTTLTPSILNVSSSFLQVTRPCIKAFISLNFSQFPSRTTKLAALECVKIWCMTADLAAVDPEKFPQTYNPRDVVTILALKFDSAL